MNDNEIVKNILKYFFRDIAPSHLRRQCPNQMLWEGIRQPDAVTIEQNGIVNFLLQQNEFYVFPELFPAICENTSPEHVCISSETLGAMHKDEICELINNEPTYVVSCDFQWMIILTSENTHNGDQLCVLVYANS